MTVGKPTKPARWTQITASGTTRVAHGYLKSVPGIGGRIKFSNPVHVVHYSEKGRSPAEPFSMGERMYLRQLSAYLNGDSLPLADEPLKTDGLYSLVRHPLYLFGLLILWPVTEMSTGYLGLCIGITIYVIVGSWLEERRMLASYGMPYREYCTRVPWLFPCPRPRKLPDKIIDSSL